MNDNKALEALKVYGNGGNPDWLRTEAYDVVIAALVELAEIKKKPSYEDCMKSAKDFIKETEEDTSTYHSGAEIAGMRELLSALITLKGEPK